MKVKEIDRTANVAWSPASQHPIYLAAGTAAQQLDATFSTSASLEIYGLNLTEPGLDMSIKGSIPSDFRFHKVVWGSHGMNHNGEHPNGVIVGGADGGNIFMYDPEKLIKGETPLIYQRDKHTGAVTSLDFNPFQGNLLASGASESEIFIWDLNNPNSPMTPGPKSQPGDDVTCVAWNRQVQHILASTFSARCIVWDLRKNEPIIKVSDSTSRMRCKAVAWHPEVATQMCLASEDDHAPVIQLWDLRFATAPLKSLEGHQRGVLSIAWCPQDPDLLLSCGKDSRILCWNPNSMLQGGEIVCELPLSNQWSFDVAWCPRNPAVMASSSFDGHVSIYSMMGGQQQTQPSSKLVEAFPGADAFGQAPIPQVENRGVSVTLKKAPKWLRKPVGASFAFGGKLISFENLKPSNQQSQPQHLITISQVVTEPELIDRSYQLERALAAGEYSEFCQGKVNMSKSSPHDEKLWSFLKANFDSSPRMAFLSLLGYNPQEIHAKISTCIGLIPPSRGQGDESQIGIDAEELAQRMNALGNAANSMRASPNSLINLSASRTPENTLNFMGDGATAFDAIALGQSEDISPDSPICSFPIPTSDDVNGLISKSLLTGNIELAVDLCLKNGQMADAIMLAMAGGNDLLAKTQKKYFMASKGELGKLIAAVVRDDWNRVMRSCEIDSWKEALVACLTYSKPQEFPSLCEIIGNRLETERNGEMLKQAMLCYICAGNVEKFVECWVKTRNEPNSPVALQELVEVMMLLRKSVELQQPGSIEISPGILATKLTEYANLLAAQGSLSTAIVYLGTSNENSIAILRDRIHHALGIVAPRSSIPNVDRRSSLGGRYSSSIQTAPQTKPMGYQQPQSNNQPSANQYMPPSVHGYQQPGMAPPAIPTYPNSMAPAAVTPAPPFSAGPVSATSQPPITNTYSKGHLSSRYPTHPQDPSIASQSGSGSYMQPNYYTHNFSQTTITQALPGYSQTSYTDYIMSSGPGNVTSNLGPTTGQYLQNTYNPQATPYSAGAYSIPGSTPQIAPGVAGTPPTDSMFHEAKPGWNDPPNLKTQAKHEFEPPAPITHPLFDMPAPDQMGPPSAYPPGNYIQSGIVGGYPQMQQQHQQQSVIQEHAPPQQSQPQPPIQEPPKPKGPIPAEHQILQDIFEDLKNKCMNAATNPQTKRKLDDVTRKLETLYDRLRENGLSQPTLLGLHQIVQVIQQCDYQAALQIHSQIVTSGTFSEIGNFMPGLKVLLQTALTLKVYLQ